jgi:hypothetical protein
MAQKYIAVFNGKKIERAVFICCGKNRCYWEQHVRPLVEGGKYQSYKGFNDLKWAIKFAGSTSDEVKLIRRDEAKRLIAA